MTFSTSSHKKETQDPDENLSRALETIADGYSTYKSNSIINPWTALSK